MNFSGPGYNVTINMPDRASLFPTLTRRLREKSGFALATLNVDHLSKLPYDPAFSQAYDAHDLIVADGRPIVWLSQLGQRPVALIPGSDLIVPMCELAAESGTSVALVGSNEHALAAAARRIKAEVIGVRIVMCHAPPYGFDPTGTDAEAICKMLNESGAGICFVALGAPKQEIFAAFARGRCPSIGFASIGAGLDFLAGEQVRAPRWMRALAVEWIWRLLQNPRRMGPRYAKCFTVLPLLAKRAFAQRP